MANFIKNSDETRSEGGKLNTVSTAIFSVEKFKKEKIDISDVSSRVMI
jgi:hypothetical protein